MHYNLIANIIEICRNDSFSHHQDRIPMQPEAIRDMIEAGLPDAQAHVEGDGAHFTAVVVSKAFTGKSRLQKQKMVYDTVKSQLLDGSLHALSIKAFTPEEWDALDDSQDKA